MFRCAVKIKVLRFEIMQLVLLGQRLKSHKFIPNDVEFCPGYIWERQLRDSKPFIFGKYFLHKSSLGVVQEGGR